MPEKFSSEKSYEGHKNAARQLGWDREKKGALDKSNPASRIIAAISGKREEVEAAVKQSEKTYEENLQLAQEHIDEMHEEANEYVRTYEIYQKERERLAQEFGSQYTERVESVPWPGSSADISSYIDELQRLKLEDSTSLDDKARILAAIDIVKPRMKNEGYAGMTFMIGEGYDRSEVGIHNGTRFPRWEIGKDDMESATEIAKDKKWKHILEVSTFVTLPRKKDSNEPPYVKAKKDVFIPISEDMSKLLEQAGADNLDSGSSLHVAWGRDEGRHTGGLNENFRVINLEEAETSK